MAASVKEKPKAQKKRGVSRQRYTVASKGTHTRSKKKKTRYYIALWSIVFAVCIILLIKDSFFKSGELKLAGFSFKESEKFGFMDINGNIEIPAKYDSRIYYFSHGLAVISLDGKFGYADKKGEEKIAAVYSSAKVFAEKLAAVSIDSYVGVSGESFGYINTDGEFEISPKFQDASTFSEGLAAVKINGLWGFIDKKGNIKIEPKYETVSAFSNGYAAVEKNRMWGIIDKKGGETVECIYEYIGTPIEGNLIIAQKDGKFGYIDKHGRVLIPFEYDNAENFSENVAKVFKNNLYGYIDRDNNFALPLKYTDASGFADGLAFVKENDSDLYSVINMKEENITNSQFTDYRAYENGMARVSVGGKWGVIDKKGKYVINPQYDAISHFSQNRAIAMLGSKVGVIDKNGNIIVDIKYDNNYSFVYDGLSFVYEQ